MIIGLLLNNQGEEINEEDSAPIINSDKEPKNYNSINNYREELWKKIIFVWIICFYLFFYNEYATINI